MAKNSTKKKKKDKTGSKSTPDLSQPIEPSRCSGHPLTVSDLRNDKALWYKILLLIYDLKNIKSDHNSEQRLNLTTHERYLGAPYFTTEEEVERVRGALVDGASVDEAIMKKLEGFFEKRKASGDARPCGPHDMVPVYLECFEIGKEEIVDEGFVGRVRRNGLR